MSDRVGNDGSGKKSSNTILILGAIGAGLYLWSKSKDEEKKSDEGKAFDPDNKSVDTKVSREDVIKTLVSLDSYDDIKRSGTSIATTLVDLLQGTGSFEDIVKESDYLNGILDEIAPDVFGSQKVDFIKDAKDLLLGYSSEVSIDDNDVQNWFVKMKAAA